MQLLRRNLWICKVIPWTNNYDAMIAKKFGGMRILMQRHKSHCVEPLHSAAMPLLVTKESADPGLLKTVIKTSYLNV